MSELILSNDLGEFFRKEVTHARSALGIGLSELTEYYLVNLLCDFSRGSRGPEVGHEPLALNEGTVPVVDTLAID